MTHAPRNGEGEKLAEETVLLETASPLPKALKHTRTFILNFGSDVLRTPIFFFPVGTLVQCLQRLLSQEGSPVVVERPRPSFRLLHVLKHVPSHRPQHLAFHLMEGEPQKICQHAAFQIWGGTSVLSSSLPGTWSPQVWLQNFPLAQGGFFFVLFSATPQNEGELRGEENG